MVVKNLLNTGIKSCPDYKIKSMTKTELYKEHGDRLVKTNPNDMEYGEHLLLYPEDNELAEFYAAAGYELYTVYEGPAEDSDDIVEAGLDTGEHPYKLGYLVLERGYVTP